MADKANSPQVTPGRDTAVALQLTVVGSPQCLLQSIPMQSVLPVFAFQKTPEPLPCFHGNAEQSDVGYLQNGGAGVVHSLTRALQ